MSALADHMAAGFDESLAGHLQRFAPREARTLGTGGLRAIARLGRQRAAEFDLTNRESIRLYVELMFLLGSGFATDPQYPWVPAALAPAGERQDHWQRSGALHAGAIEYAHKALGAKREFLSSALERLTMHRFSNFLGAGHFPESLIEKLGFVFPEKVAYVGLERLRMLAQSAQKTAEQHGIAGGGSILLTILMFLLGHEVDRDPITPWVGAILHNSALMDPPARIEMLANKAWEELRNGMGGSCDRSPGAPI